MKFSHINAISAETSRSLSDLIPAEFIHQALTLTDTVTLHERKLPLEFMIWQVVTVTTFNTSQSPAGSLLETMRATELTHLSMQASNKDLGFLLPISWIHYQRTHCINYSSSPHIHVRSLCLHLDVNLGQYFSRNVF